MTVRNNKEKLPAMLLHTDKEHMSKLHVRLAERAEEAGLLDVAYRTMDTPIGTLLLAATPKGLLRIGLRGEDHDETLAAISETISPRILHSPARLESVVIQLDHYFLGKLRKFDLPLDMSLSKGFRLEVLEHLNRVSFGKTVTYTELAHSAGNPRAVRAVGSACATNPIPVVIPCHRVLRADGTPGGYLGGLDMKRTLLKLEGITI